MQSDPYDSPPGEPTSGGGGKVFVIVIVVLVAVCLVGAAVMGILAAVLAPSFMRAKEKADQTKCASNLRQLGLASAQYSDDKRFYPHVSAIRELDGDAETNHGPKAFRALINSGYLDQADVFVCPASFDMAQPTRVANREWFWDGDTRPDPAADPIGDGLDDPALVATDELSYGWTRRGFNRNVRSSTVLAADRGLPGAALDPDLGNHPTGLNVLRADGTVIFEHAARDPLSTLTDPEGDALGLVPWR